MRDGNTHQPAIEVLHQSARLAQSHAGCDLSPLLPQWIVLRKKVVQDILAHRNAEALPAQEERPLSAQENIRIEKPDMSAAASLPRQQVQHELRLVKCQMNPRFNRHENHPDLLR